MTIYLQPAVRVELTTGGLLTTRGLYYRVHLFKVFGRYCMVLKSSSPQSLAIRLGLVSFTMHDLRALDTRVTSSANALPILPVILCPCDKASTVWATVSVRIFGSSFLIASLAASI